MFKIVVIFTCFLEIILSDSLTSFYNIRSDKNNSTYQEFLCISDDLSDALAWNFPITKEYRLLFENKNVENDDDERIEFYNPDMPVYSISSYSVNSSDAYPMHNPWQMTHSYDNPMGPVYDSRWEDFREYFIEEFQTLVRSGMLYYGARPNLIKKTGALVFSIKGPSMISIFLCATPNVMNDFCYWVKINGKKNMKTVIRKCEHGIPKNSTNCSSQSDSINTPIDFQEWKTFVLKWKEKERKIELYDELDLILTYKDSDYKFDKNSDYYAYFSNPSDNVIIRFHDYKYFYTTQIGSNMERLTSFSNLNWPKNFFEKMCMTMLVGLCYHCGLNIKVIDAVGKNIMTHEVLSNLAVHNLPMWKEVTFYIQNTSDIVYPINLELETFSMIPEKNLTGHWAIKQLNKCFSKVKFKRAFIKIPVTNEDSTFPIWCQRLSYKFSNIENLNLRAPRFSVPKDHFENCPPNSIGPHCATSCERYFSSGCDSLIKCTKNHCFCNQDHPSCKRGSKIDPPSIARITKTSAYAYFKAINEYVNNGVIIGFELKANPDDKKIKRYAGRLGKSNNSDDKYYHTTFTNLKPGTEYSVRMYISYKLYDDSKMKTIMGETATFRTLPMTLDIPTLVTMVQEGKGKAILSWKSPSFERDKIIKFLIHQEIIASKLEEKPILNKKKIIQIPFAESITEYVVYLDLLPSTHYRISIQAEGKNEKGNLSTIEIQSQSALAFKYDPSANLDNENRQINVILPPVANNTENSMFYIIVKGSPICKQGGALSSNLRKMIELEYNEVAWMAATFCTYKTADKLFIVGDELIYNDVIANCPLHPGNSYVIYILVRERGDYNELQEFPALLWKSPEFRVSSNFQHWKYWAIPLAVLILILCGIIYRYYKT